MSAAKGLVSLSPALQAVAGTVKTTRPQVMKGVWAYIKDKNLQQPDKKTVINCDPAMKAVFGQDQIHMTHVMKGIQPHMTKIEAN